MEKNLCIRRVVFLLAKALWQFFKIKSKAEFSLVQCFSKLQAGNVICEVQKCEFFTIEKGRKITDRHNVNVCVLKCLTTEGRGVQDMGM